MNSLLFNVLIKILKPVLWTLSIWLLMRGHQAPGGGFVSGLLAASTVILEVLANGWSSIPTKQRDNLFSIAGLGLSLSVMSGLFALYIKVPFMTGQWISYKGWELGTPQLFDFGIFLLVYSVTIICTGLMLNEEEETAS